jgi:acyl carrier protein
MIEEAQSQTTRHPATGVDSAAFDHHEAVANRLISVLAAIKQVPADTVDLGPDDDFLREFDMDSIDAVELTVQLDTVFEVGFGEEPGDLDCLASFGSLVDLVVERGRLDLLEQA